MKTFIKNTFNYLFQSSWATVLLSLAFPFLFIETENGWILFFSLLYFFPAAIIHYKGKRWIGYISSLLSLMVTVLLTLLLGMSMAYFPNPFDVHEDYAARYENREKIESITGISIPEFTVESSKITHIGQFDFEFTTDAVLKFKTLPSEKTFRYLDSICELEVLDSVDTSSKIFAPGIESYYPCWSKEKNKYQFSIVSDLLKVRLHKEDAFFTLTLEKNSPYAELRYGNY